MSSTASEKIFPSALTASFVRSKNLLPAASSVTVVWATAAETEVNVREEDGRAEAGSSPSAVVVKGAEACVMDDEEGL